MAYPIKGKYYSRKNKNPNADYTFTLADGLDFNNHKLDTSIYKITRKMGLDFVDEKLFVPDSELLIEYKFKLVGGKWFLVYYSDVDEEM